MSSLAVNRIRRSDSPVVRDKGSVSPGEAGGRAVDRLPHAATEAARPHAPRSTKFICRRCRRRDSGP